MEGNIFTDFICRVIMITQWLENLLEKGIFDFFTTKYRANSMCDDVKSYCNRSRYVTVTLKSLNIST